MNKLQTLFPLFTVSGPLFSIVYSLFCKNGGGGDPLGRACVSTLSLYSLTGGFLPSR
jgi:hypothetical protein